MREDEESIVNQLGRVSCGEAAVLQLGSGTHGLQIGRYERRTETEKVEGKEDSMGTLVDLLLGKALTYSSDCS